LVNPTRSKVKRRVPARAPAAWAFEGGPPELAGRPHEAVGNGGPREMTAGRRTPATESGLQADSSPKCLRPRHFSLVIMALACFWPVL